MTDVNPPAGRNDPCPCGSGRRYKQCHGALPAEADAALAPSPAVLTRQGMAAHQRGDLDSAERDYRAALTAAPEFPAALHYLGVVLYQRGRLSEALPLLERAVDLVPQEPEFHNNLGLALAAAARDAEAIPAYERALALNPAHAGACNNLGLALHATGDPEGAIRAYRRGLALAPDFPQLHWNLALALLTEGRYGEGWREYEWRLAAPETQAKLRAFPGPRWTGEPCAGKTLLLAAEQGLGDALQALRFAGAVAARGARVVVAVPEPLRNLARTAPGVAQVVGPDDALPAYDAHASLMSLPAILDVTQAQIAVPVPYLRADPALRAEAIAQVARAAPDVLRVGLAWAGAPDNAVNARRSMPLAQMAAMLDVPGVRWFSLKRDGEDVADAERPLARQLVALPMRNDFDGLAALVDALDLVLTVDTSFGHLAGALGKPVWILLARAPDWRWGRSRNDTPWYPTARLFRQQHAGDWTHPLREAAAALQSRMQGLRSP